MGESHLRRIVLTDWRDFFQTRRRLEPDQPEGKLKKEKITMKLQNLILILILIVCIGLLPQTQAVSPTPDGCYPGFTTAEGCNALSLLGSGAGNTGIGWYSLFLVGAGNFNTGVGAGTLVLNTGDSNTAVGAAALLLNTSGTGNTAVGTDALVHNDTGSFNIAIGDDTLNNNVSGSGNIIVGGFGAGFNIVAGSNNIYIGPGVSANGPFDESDTIRIRDSAPAAGGATSQVFFAGIDGSTVGAVNAPVLINPNGQLGTGVSSARFKKDIDPMGRTSEAIFSLKPVTFHYKGDMTNTPQYGLIAEEVAKVNPALILTDKEGKPYSVRYEHINAMLLNEFLKEHRKVENLKNDFQATVAQQQNEIAALTATVKEQAAQIQRVSTQLAGASPSRGGLEASKFAAGRIRGAGPAPQVVNNP
jgi:Chaperone of endosialidase